MLTQYICEICHQNYDDRQLASDCEEKGFANLAWPPKGMLYSLGNRGEDMTFAVADLTIFANNRHLAIANLWACRDTNAGDSLGEETCGGAGFVHETYFAPPNLESKACQRLIVWLQKQNVPITLATGKWGKSIALDQYWLKKIKHSAQGLGFS